MRRIDADAAPLREEAERIAREYLREEGVSSPRPPPRSRSPRSDERSTCASCDTSNEPDAAFCKKCGASMKSASDAESSDASS